MAEKGVVIVPSILFVCTANLCRSPIATALLQRRFTSGTDTATWQIDSAGTCAKSGLPAAKRAQTVMQEQGIDLSQHRSRTVTPALMESRSLILGLSRGHREALRVEFPEHARRIFTLSQMIGESYDIADPIKGSLHDIRDTARDIDHLLAHGLERIIRLATEYVQTRTVVDHNVVTTPQLAAATQQQMKEEHHAGLWRRFN